MQDRDIISAGLLAPGSSSTGAGEILGVNLPGTRVTYVPFLMLAIPGIVAMSAALFVCSMPGNHLPL